MAQVNVHEAKTHFSRLLRRVEGGEVVTISRGGKPVARLVPLEQRKEKRELGGDEGEGWIAEDFDAPLPDLIRDFEGE
ncbi:MAG: type II toxin-antitoxin system Phd/YefM family antitoxin [Acidobacteriota bacterium]